MSTEGVDRRHPQINGEQVVTLEEAPVDWSEFRDLSRRLTTGLSTNSGSEIIDITKSVVCIRKEDGRMIYPDHLRVSDVASILNQLSLTGEGKKALGIQEGDQDQKVTPKGVVDFLTALQPEKDNPPQAKPLVPEVTTLVSRIQSWIDKPKTDTASGNLVIPQEQFSLLAILNLLDSFPQLEALMQDSLDTYHKARGTPRNQIPELRTTQGIGTIHLLTAEYKGMREASGKTTREKKKELSQIAAERRKGAKERAVERNEALMRRQVLEARGQQELAQIRGEKQVDIAYADGAGARLNAQIAADDLRLSQVQTEQKVQEATNELERIQAQGEQEAQRAKIQADWQRRNATVAGLSHTPTDVVRGAVNGLADIFSDLYHRIKPGNQPQQQNP